MPTILYPDVPPYPGVPQLLRAENSAIAASPVLSIGIGTAENVLLGALLSPPKWGIFDEFNNQLGVSSTSGGVLTALSGALLSQFTGITAPILSTSELERTREMRVSNYPLEGGSFASYNKVQLPATITVTLILQGTVDDGTAFLQAIEAATLSTDLYSVVTPEYVYTNYTIEMNRIARRAQRGANMLIMELNLIEIREVSSTFTTAIATPINEPQDATATPATNNGIEQPAAPPVSTLKSLSNGVSQYWSKFFSGGN